MSQARERTLGDLGHRRVSRVELFPPTVPSLVSTAGALIFGKTTGSIISWAVLAGAAKGTMFYNSALNTPAWLAAGALGSMMYNSAASTPAWLTAGSNNFFLKMGATLPSWFDLFGTANTFTKIQTIKLDNASGADRADGLILKGSTNANLNFNFGIHTEAATPYADIGFVEDTVAWRNIVLGKNSEGRVSVGSATWGGRFSVYGSVAGTVVAYLKGAPAQTANLITAVNDASVDQFTVSANGDGYFSRGFGVGVAAPTNAGDVRFAGAFGVNVAPPTGAGYVEFDHSDAVQGGNGLLIRNTSTGDAGIKFRTTSFGVNLWQVFLSDSGSAVKIGRDSLADYFIVKATATQVPSGLYFDALTDGSTGGFRAGATQDVVLFRGAADRWDIGTGDSLFLVSGGLGVGNANTVVGVCDVSIGYRIAAAATSGRYLRGNGTNFVSSAIQIADLPAGVSAQPMLAAERFV